MDRIVHRAYPSKTMNEYLCGKRHNSFPVSEIDFRPGVPALTGGGYRGNRESVGRLKSQRFLRCLG
jgi:hypothetical protein